MTFENQKEMKKVFHSLILIHFDKTRYPINTKYLSTPKVLNKLNRLYYYQSFLGFLKVN